MLLFKFKFVLFCNEMAAQGTTLLQIAVSSSLSYGQQFAALLLADWNNKTICRFAN